eukprot:CFRG4499T1
MYGIVEPRIRLEVMNKYQITFVLFVTYLAVVLASLSAVYEIRLGTASIVQDGAACESSDLNVGHALPVVESMQYNASRKDMSLFTPCTNVNKNWLAWTGRVDHWSPLFGSFGLSLIIRRIPRFRAFDLVLPYTVEVYGAETENDDIRLIRTIGHKHLRLACSSSYNEKKHERSYTHTHFDGQHTQISKSKYVHRRNYTSTSANTPRTSPLSEDTSTDVAVPITTVTSGPISTNAPVRNTNQAPCAVEVLFHKSEISCFACADRLQDFTIFELRVNFTVSENRSQDWETLHKLLGTNSFSYSIEYNQLLYHTTEIVIRAVMLSLTSFILAYYTHQLTVSKSRFYDNLPEQRYIIGLLGATIMYQNPLSIATLITGAYSFYVGGQVMITTATAILMALYLFVFDCIQLPGSHDRTVVFYLPKIVFAMSYWFVSILLLFLRVTKYDEDVQEFDVDSLVMMFVVVLEYLKIILMCSWVLWIVVIIINARSRLRPLSYLRTRYRQLPFRYFILQGWCVLVFMVVMVVRGLISRSLLDVGKDTALLGVVFIITVYNILLAYIYLPPKRYQLDCCCKMGHSREDDIESYHMLGDFERQGVTRLSSIGSITDLSTNLSTELISRIPSFSGSAPPGDEIAGFTSLGDGHVERTVSHTKQRYSPILASLLLKYSIQSYYDPPDRTTTSGWGKISENVSIIDFISDDTCDAHVLVARRDRFLVVAFRGTSSKINWESNLKFNQVPLPTGINPTTVMSSLFVPKVHRGFWTAYSGLRERLLKSIHSYLRNPINCHEINSGSGVMGSDLELLVTGHSLGGALATFAAYELSLHLQVRVQLYTFGSPRTGNQFWGLFFDAAVPNSFRVVYDGDIVTAVPMKVLLYRHVGTEVVVERHGNTIISPTYVERVFRSKGKRGINAHMCGSYEAAVTSCVREIMSFVAEKESLDDIATLRMLRNSESFTDGELLMLAGLRKTPAADNEDEPTFEESEDYAHLSNLHRARNNEREEVKDIVSRAEAEWSIVALVAHRARQFFSRIHGLSRATSLSNTYYRESEGDKIHVNGYRPVSQGDESSEDELFDLEDFSCKDAAVTATSLSGNDRLNVNGTKAISAPNVSIPGWDRWAMDESVLRGGAGVSGMIGMLSPRYSSSPVLHNVLTRLDLWSSRIHSRRERPLELSSDSDDDGYSLRSLRIEPRESNFREDSGSDMSPHRSFSNQNLGVGKSRSAGFRQRESTGRSGFTTTLIDSLNTNARVGVGEDEGIETRMNDNLEMKDFVRFDSGKFDDGGINMQKLDEEDMDMDLDLTSMELS